MVGLAAHVQVGVVAWKKGWMKGTRVLCCGPLSARKRKRRLCEFLRDRMTTGGQREQKMISRTLSPLYHSSVYNLGGPEFKRTLRYTLHSRSPAASPTSSRMSTPGKKRVLRRYNLKRGFFFFLCVSPPLLPHRVVDGRKKNLPHFPHVKFGEKSENKCSPFFPTGKLEHTQKKQKLISLSGYGGGSNFLRRVICPSEGDRPTTESPPHKKPLSVGWCSIDLV